MPLVLVHGVPETDAIWDPLVVALGRDDVIRLSPPGFGAPVPQGFDPVRSSYAAWLVDQLAGIARSVDGAIDLVGHDWGAGHSLGVVATRPELVRSWALDCAGLVHPDYVWHDMAQLWRTPEVGEETIAGMTSTSVDDRAAMMQSLGMTADIAWRVAQANDETMGRCILSLYRSADPHELATVWDALPAASSRPGLVLIPTDDPYVGPTRNAVAVADRAGATTAHLDGLGHWWMIEDPTAAATALRAFWGSLDG